MPEPSRRRDRLPRQPGPALDDDYPGRRSGALPQFPVEPAQASDEDVRIPAPVRMVHPDEAGTTAPDLISLSLIHRQDNGPPWHPARCGSDDRHVQVSR